MRLWENKCDLMEEFSYGKINVILWEKKCYAKIKWGNMYNEYGNDTISSNMELKNLHSRHF